MRRVAVYTLSHIPILYQTSPDKAPDSCDSTLAPHRRIALKVDRPVTDARLVFSSIYPFENDGSASKLGALSCDGNCGAVTRDLGSVIYEVLGSVGVISGLFVSIV